MDKKEAEACPVMGTIFLVSFRVIYIYVHVSVVCQITWNHVNQTRTLKVSIGR